MITIDIPSKQADEMTSDAIGSLAAVETLDVMAIGIEESTEIIREVKTRFKEVEAMKKEIADPIKTALDKVTKLFKPALDSLAKAEKVLKAKVLAARSIAHEQSDTMMLEAGKAGDMDMVRAADEARPRAVEGVSVRESWELEILDADAIPREYMIPDVKSLKALVRAQKAAFELPGCNAKRCETMAIRT